MSIQNLAGQTLGQYELRELLGEGGMGAVYRAYQRTLDREVAVKVLPASLAAQAGYMERFTREARTAAALEHQNIVPVYDYGTQGGISYVVMRQLTGGTLADRLAHSIEENRPLPSLQETAQITRQLASALDYAHSKGVIHRDIKANNIMFDSQGTPFVVDFGIAKLLNATSALTGTGVAMGTPSYMAPEQWRGTEIGPAADQYALAVLVYAMLTGKMPFEADSPYQLMHKHMFDEPTPIHNYRADLPEAVQPVFDRAFAKEPSARFSNTTEFAKALDEAVRGLITQEPTGFFLTPLPVRRLNIPLQATPSSVEGPTVTPTNLNAVGAFQATVADVPVDKTSMPAPPSTPSGTPPITPPQPATSSGRGWIPLAVLGLAAVIILMVGIIFVLQDNGGHEDNSQSGGRPTHTTNPTLDPVEIAQGLLTATAQARTPASVTADETQTIQAILTQFAQGSADTPVTSGSTTAVAVNPTTEISPTATSTATSNSSPTATRTSTPNAVQTLEARATIYFEQTSAAQGGQETQATTTPSPTITRFPTATASPTPTAKRNNSPSPATTATPTVTASSTLNVEATTNAAATQTAESGAATHAAEQANATSNVASTHQAATQNAVQTLIVHATADAKSTLAVVAPTQTAQAIAAAIQIGETNREVNVRKEPGTNAEILATLRQGTHLTILGTNEDGSWFNVELNNGTTGWIRADLLTVLGTPTPTPTPSATPEIQEFNQVAMVFVPAGCYTMGSDEAQLKFAISAGTPKDIANVEAPPQEICFDTPFWIDQYEVTNGQFAELGGQAAKGAVTTDPDAPREQVSWFEAKAYCEMRGGRLPSEAEWEYAARGPANLIYPWGNTFVLNNAISLGNSRKQAQPVGSRPDGISWVGAYDMSGNVWEWTNSIFAAYPYDATDGREGDGDGNRIVRGGSYQDNDEFLRTSMRAFWVPPNDGYASVGFRCVLDYEERG